MQQAIKSGAGGANVSFDPAKMTVTYGPLGMAEGEGCPCELKIEPAGSGAGKPRTIEINSAGRLKVKDGADA
ncbi:hypothetical protein GCM10027172_16560 [Halomonas garicola]